MLSQQSHYIYIKMGFLEIKLSTWNIFIKQVQDHLDDLSSVGCDMPFFRGHYDATWRLLCGLGRQSPQVFEAIDIESILYYDFLSMGGILIGRQYDSWDIAFAMQHHGLPTRLLDWTTTFASALFFALRPHLELRNSPFSPTPPSTPCVWILDPFALNKSMGQESFIAHPQTDVKGTYSENFIENTNSMAAPAIAILPPQHSPRQAAQRSVFTLHGNLFDPLESLAPKCLKRFDLPTDSIDEAIGFLSLAGVNEFTIFPDLDGLARHLKAQHIRWSPK